jgi:hypothetical protein
MFSKGFPFRIHGHQLQSHKEHDKYRQVLPKLGYRFIHPHFSENILNRGRTQGPTQLLFSPPQLLTVWTPFLFAHARQELVRSLRGNAAAREIASDRYHAGISFPIRYNTFSIKAVLLVISDTSSILGNRKRQWPGITESRSRVAPNPASYSSSPGFKFWLRGEIIHSDKLQDWNMATSF